jgi:hypothetical protein
VTNVLHGSYNFFFRGSTAQAGLGVLIAEVMRSYSDSLGMTPLDDWSVATHDTYKKQTSIHPEGLEPTIPANEQPQNLALDRAATGTVTSSLLLRTSCGG